MEEDPPPVRSRETMRGGASPIPERAAPGALPVGKRGVWRADRWRWARRWELWLALALGAILRLWHLDVSAILADQAGLMTLARESVLRHALPLSGIPSSIGSLNPPLSIYLLLPFAALGRDPFPAIVSLALWNVLGIALCYLFADRYFGRRVAAIATLLFAVCGAAVGFSRFLWQQNYLPPLLVLWALATYACCVRGTRWTFAAAVLLLAGAAELHPTALLLAPVLLAALLLTPRRPRWPEYALGALGLALLVVPTLLWEAVSSGADLRALSRFTSSHAAVDPAVLFRLYEALGGPYGAHGTLTPLLRAPKSLGGALALMLSTPTAPILNAQSPYTAFAPASLALALASLLLFCGGWLVLTARLLAPARALWRARPRDVPLPRQAAIWAAAIWRGLRADAAWRVRLLLWLGVTLPIVLLLRHSSAVYTHYLLVLYPFAFITSACAVTWLLDHAGRYGAHSSRLRIVRTGERRLGALVVLLLLAAFISGQALQSLLYEASLAGGQSIATHTAGGYPLDALWHADSALAALRGTLGGATVAVIETPSNAASLDYSLVREHPTRTGFVNSCLVLPAVSSGPALLVTTESASQAAQFLAQSPVATRVAAIPMPGNPSFTVYRVAGLPTLLPDETPLAPLLYRDASGNALRLDALARTSPTTVRLRWTVLTASALGVPRSYRIATREQHPDGSTASGLSFADCAPTAWHAGDTMYTWERVPAASVTVPSQTVSVQVQEWNTMLFARSVGPLRVIAGESVSTPWQTLTPSAAVP
ncbi:MAG: glycosyltransferase family 39 protein [Ktedonobacterales bacterium]